MEAKAKREQFTPPVVIPASSKPVNSLTYASSDSKVIEQGPIVTPPSTASSKPVNSLTYASSEAKATAQGPMVSPTATPVAHQVQQNQD